MARPRKNEHIKPALLEAGTHAYSEKGYHGTGLKQILDEVGVPKGSFYNYFSSKEDYTAEIIDNYMNGLLDIFDQLVSASKEDPVTTVERVYQLMINEFDHQNCVKGCLLGNLAAEMGGTSEVCRQALARGYSKWQVRFVKLIEQAQQQSLIRDDLSAEDISELFWCAWEGSILKMKMDGNTAVIKQTIQHLLRVVLAK